MHVPSRFGATVLALVLLFAALVNARSSVIVNFSGGNGTPLVMELPSAIGFTVYQSAPVSPIFVLKATGQVTNGSFVLGSGLSFSINGGASTPINVLNSGGSGGAVSPDDIYFYGSLAGVTMGDVVTINAGIFTTTEAVTYSAPVGNSFTSFIVGDAQVDQISTDAVAVPEPSTILLVAAGSVGVMLMRRRRGV